MLLPKVMPGDFATYNDPTLGPVTVTIDSFSMTSEGTIYYKVLTEKETKVVLEDDLMIGSRLQHPAHSVGEPVLIQLNPSESTTGVIVRINSSNELDEEGVIISSVEYEVQDDISGDIHVVDVVDIQDSYKGD